MKVTDPREFGRVVVLMGGTSAEREVSLKSGNAVLQALLAKGVDAVAVDATGDVFGKLRSAGAQRAFIALHGRGGEDGVMQGALEMLGLPYTGSGVLASAVGMDKWRTKLLWQGAGLPVPEYEMVDADSDFNAVEQRLGLPLFVKPANEGSSVGVTKVKQAGGIRAAWAGAAKHDALVIAERFIGGGEYTVPVLNGSALPVIKIEPVSEFYDYEAKYLRDDTRYLCPCGLSSEEEMGMQRLAERAFEV
jgi:D-alanine-D-alanine ligase